MQAYKNRTTHNNKSAARHWPALRVGLLASTAIAALWLSSEAARAACAPGAASNVTATCTGTTLNQGPEANVGYGAGALTNLTVTVVPGATVTGNDHGVLFATGTVFNSGTITGTAVYGIRGNTANVTNSGTIIGGSGTAIRFAGASFADTLNVLPGARFGGLIDFGGGADRVNFGAGSYIINTANFNNALSTITTGGNPYAVTANQIVVADLSGFGAMNRAMMDITGWISSVLPETPVFGPAPNGGGASAFAAIDHAARIDETFASFPLDAMGYMPAKAPVFKGGTAAYTDGSAVWAKGFGGRREQQTSDSFIGSVTIGYGGAFGYERSVAPDLRLGAFVGASANKTDLKLNAGGTDTDVMFGGLYGRATMAASFLDLSLIGGRLDNDSRRNIGGGLNIETARASYEGWFVNPALTLGHRFAVERGLTLTPAFKLRYVGVRFDGYNETGSTSNLTVGSRSIGALEERAELTLTHVRDLPDASRMTWRVSGGVLAQQRSGDSTVNVALLGQSFVAATPDQNNVTGYFGGGGLEWQRGQVALFASGEATATNDSTRTYAGKGGVRVAW